MVEQSQQKDLPQSFFGASLSQILPKLGKSTDSVRVLLIASDMILNNKRLVNFYRYGDKLMDNYALIVKKIENAYPELKEIDLTGIQIYAVYLPNEKTDKLAKATRDFWRKWFTSKGATTEFLPNLPSQKALAKG